MRIPEPELGLVIAYSFVWSREAARGVTEGLKDRPCSIVLTTGTTEEGCSEVVVAPITHSQPADPSVAIEIPPKIKRALGLDGERSWIVLDEFNSFAWPGFDLRATGRDAATCVYGLLPPIFFAKILERLDEIRESGRIWITPRDE